MLAIVERNPLRWRLALRAVRDGSYIQKMARPDAVREGGTCKLPQASRTAEFARFSFRQPSVSRRPAEVLPAKKRVTQSRVFRTRANLTVDGNHDFEYYVMA